VPDRLAALADDASFVALDVDLDGCLAGVRVDGHGGHLDLGSGGGGGGGVGVGVLPRRLGFFFAVFVFIILGVVGIASLGIASLGILGAAPALALLLLDGFGYGLGERGVGLGGRRRLFVRIRGGGICGDRMDGWGRSVRVQLCVLAMLGLMTCSRVSRDRAAT
jgi:hypothetical protein